MTAGTTASLRRRRAYNEKWLLSRGAIFLCRPSVLITVIALLDHDYAAVAMVVTPAPMPATIVTYLGARAVPAMMMTSPAMMMTAALDDDGLGAGDRRHSHRHRTECRQHISKLLHGVLLHSEMRTAGAEETFRRNRKEFSERLFRQFVAAARAVQSMIDWRIGASMPSSRQRGDGLPARSCMRAPIRLRLAQARRAAHHRGTRIFIFGGALP